MGRGLIALVLAGIVIPPIIPPPPRPAPQGKVRVDSTKDPAEERELVPLTRTARARPEVAVSMSAGELPGLRRNDLLRVSAEVETTNNCRHPGSLCVTSPYPYDPKVGVQLFLARGERTTGRPGALPLTPRRERTCRQREPHREHHCVAVFKRASLRLDDPGRLPCQLKRCVINMVVDAHNPKAERNEHVILGIDRPGGEVHQGRARISVARFRGPVVDGTLLRTKRRRRQAVDVKDGRGTVIYSLKLNNLAKDQQYTFDALAKAAVGHLSYDAFVGSQLVLTEGPRQTEPTKLTRQVVRRPRLINRKLGFNCTGLTTPCKLPRVGAMRLAETPERGGERVPLFVNYVLRNAPMRVDDRPGDVIRIERGGFIRATRYPAAALGKR